MARTKKARSKQCTPKQAAPKQSVPKQAASKQAIPKQAIPKQAIPKQAIAKQAIPKQGAPKQSVPKQAAPQQTAAPRATTPAKHTDPWPSGKFDPLDYMTKKELNEIDLQFASTLVGVEVLLFWTGVEWAHVQRWAAIWNMKTLTIAMGALMDPKNPSSPKAQKGKLSYSRYVKGASGRFAQYAREHCRVIVLTNPPPCIYSERENNTYQRLEEPILMGRFGASPVRRIDYLHPTIDGAAHVTYQVWPCDRTGDYAASFLSSSINRWKRIKWDYQDLVTTSQMNLEFQRTECRSSTVPVMPSQTRDQRASDPSDILPSNKNLPVCSIDVTNVADKIDSGEDIPRLLQSVETVGDHILAAGFDIKGHKSRDLNPQSRRGTSTGSDNDLTERQARCQVERGPDFHESGLLQEACRLQIPVYVIERCTRPAPPVAVPVISIDELTVGVEVNIDINEHGMNKDFLYLTMTVGAELRCWKLRWVQTEKRETHTECFKIV